MIKITTAEQLNKLIKGSLVARYPTYGEPKEAFNDKDTTGVDNFKIGWINKTTDMIELTMTGKSVPLYASAGDIGHVFLNMGSLITENKWWLYN